MWHETAVALRFVILPHSIPVKRLHYFWIPWLAQAIKTLIEINWKYITISEYHGFEKKKKIKQTLNSSDP